MEVSTGTERRRAARINRKVDMDLRGDGLAYMAETQNLAPHGVYCKLKSPIPEMTELSVTLELPGHKVRCRGTVVRSDVMPETDGSYRVAIFFNRMDEPEQEKLISFLSETSEASASDARPAGHRN